MARETRSSLLAGDESWSGLKDLVKGRHALSKLTAEQRANNFIRTSAIALATDGTTSAAVVWRGQPNHSDRVVRFVPAAADESGLHALVSVGSGLYALPPGSRVRLESVDPPRHWKLPWEDDELTKYNRGHLYTVTVTWN